MPYKYVTDSDLTPYLQFLEQRETPEDQIVPALKNYAQQLEQERGYSAAKQSNVPWIAQSFGQAAPQYLGTNLRGLAMYSPNFGDEAESRLRTAMKIGSTALAGSPFAPIGNLLSFGSEAPRPTEERLRDWSAQLMQSGDKGTQQLVQEAMEGKHGSWAKWNAVIGQQVPIFAQAMAANLVGRFVGGLIGGGAGSQAVPGPDPTDIATIPTGVAVGQWAGGAGATWAAMTVPEAAGFAQATEGLLDRDIVEGLGKTVYGPLSGAVETAQEIAMGGPWMSKGKRAAQVGKAGVRKGAKAGLVKSVLKWTGNEVLQNTIEGVEEVAQGFIFNKTLDMAVEEQNRRNAEAGLPPVDQREVEKLKQNWKQNFEMGYVVSTIMRGGGYAKRAATIATAHQVGSYQLAKEYRAELKKAEGNAVEATRNILEKSRAIGDIVLPKGWQQAQREAAVPLTSEELREVVDNLPIVTPKDSAEPSLVSLVVSINRNSDTKIPLLNADGTEASFDQLRERVKDTIDPYRGGPVVVPVGSDPHAIGEALGLEYQGIQKSEFSPPFLTFRDPVTGSNLSVVDEGKDTTAYQVTKILNSMRRKFIEAAPYSTKDPVKVSLVQYARDNDISWKNSDGSLRSPDDMRGLLIDKLASNQTVGLMSVRFNPVINKAQKAEVNYGKATENASRTLAQQMPSPTAQWFDDLRTMVKQAQGNEGQVLLTDKLKEGLQLGLSQEQINEAVANIQENPNNPAPPSNTELFIPTEEARELYRQSILKALTPVIGEFKAQATVDRIGPKMSGSTGLSEILSRDQYKAYTQNMKGNTLREARAMLGRQAVANMEVKINAKASSAPIKLKDGTVYDVTGMPTVSREAGNVAGLWTTSGPIVRALETIEARTGVRLLGLDSELFEGHKLEQRVLTLLHLAQKKYWKDLPRGFFLQKGLRTGLPARRLADLSYWMSTDEQGRRELAIREDLIKPGEEMSPEIYQKMEDMLVKKVQDAGYRKSADMIKNYARFVADNETAIYDMFAEAGAVDPRQVRDSYRPVIRMWVEEGMKTPIDQFMQDRKNTNEYVKRLNDVDRNNIVEIVDSLKSLENNNIPISGMAKPFLQYQRTMDEEFAKTMARITDTRELMDIYIRRATRKLIFGEMAPAVGEIFKQATTTKDLGADERESVNIVLNNYMDSLLGIPGRATKQLGKKNLLTTLNLTNKFINDNIVDKWNEHPLLSKFMLLDEKDTDLKYTAKDAMNDAVTLAYTVTLGIPYNTVVPIKNVATQNPMIIGALGLETYLQGMASFFNDPKRIREIMELNVRPDYAMFEGYELGFKGVGQTMAKTLLSIYRASDLINCYSAASSALTAWDRLSPMIENNTAKDLPTDQIIKTLSKGDPAGFDEKKIMNPKRKEVSVWDGVASKPMATEVAERIQNGDYEGAKKAWVQYIVNFSQWRYGAGGGVQLINKWDAFRGLLMFQSWRMNYVPYLGATYAQGYKQARKGEGATLLKRSIATSLTQFVVASLLSWLGLEGVHNWFGAGPIGEDIALSGPLVKFARIMLKLMVGGSTAIQGEIMQLSPEQREKAWRPVKKAYDDIVSEFEMPW